MFARVRTFGVVLAAVAAIAMATANAAAVQPATHRFVKGEHFRYSDVLRLGIGEGVVVLDGPQSMTSVEDIDVIDVAATAATLADRLQSDKATGFAPRTRTIHASADGTWRDGDGHVVENVATWDPARFGPRPQTLTPRQHWQVDVARIDLDAPGNAVVRVVSAGDADLVLRIEGSLVPDTRGPARVTKTWTTDVAFSRGIVRELHRVDVTRYDRCPSLSIAGTDASRSSNIHRRSAGAFMRRRLFIARRYRRRRTRGLRALRRSATSVRVVCQVGRAGALSRYGRVSWRRRRRARRRGYRSSAQGGGGRSRVRCAARRGGCISELT